MKLTKKEWLAVITTGLLSGCSGYYGGYLLGGEFLGYLSWLSNSLGNGRGVYNLIEAKKQKKESAIDSTSQLHREKKIDILTMVNWLLSIGSAAAGGVFAWRGMQQISWVQKSFSPHTLNGFLTFSNIAASSALNITEVDTMIRARPRVSTRHPEELPLLFSIESLDTWSINETQENTGWASWIYRLIFFILAFVAMYGSTTYPLNSFFLGEEADEPIKDMNSQGLYMIPSVILSIPHLALIYNAFNEATGGIKNFLKMALLRDFGTQAHSFVTTTSDVEDASDASDILQAGKLLASERIIGKVQHTRCLDSDLKAKLATAISQIMDKKSAFDVYFSSAEISNIESFIRSEQNSTSFTFDQEILKGHRFRKSNALGRYISLVFILVMASSCALNFFAVCAEAWVYLQIWYFPTELTESIYANLMGLIGALGFGCIYLHMIKPVDAAMRQGMIQCSTYANHAYNHITEKLRNYWRRPSNQAGNAGQFV